MKCHDISISTVGYDMNTILKLMSWCLGFLNLPQSIVLFVFVVYVCVRNI